MIAFLIEAALRALLVALAVGAGLRVLRVSNVPAQKAAWGLVLLCAVAMPALMRYKVMPAWTAIRLPASWARPASLTAPAPMQTGSALVLPSIKPMPVFARISRTATESLPAAALVPADLNAAPPSKIQSPGPSIKAPPVFLRIRNWIAGRGLKDAEFVLGTMYLAVLATLLVRLFYGLALAMQLWERAEVFVPIPLGDKATDPSVGLKMRFSREVGSPVTIGSGVLLPWSCLDWDAEKTRIVLAHERAHVRQGDFYLQLLAGFYSAVFWFSPLGWWLRGKLSDLGETMSDRARAG